MAAQIEETLLDRFRVDAETLRDLDAVLHQRCKEFDPTVDIKYHVRRRDGLRYETLDVEDILRERNGVETQLVSVTASSTASNELRLTLDLGKAATLGLESQDRAKAVLAASDLRALARDRMRASVWPFRTSRRSIAIGVALTFFIAIALYGFWDSDRRSNRYDAAVARYEQEYDQWIEGRSALRRGMAESFRANVDEVVESGTTEERLGLMLEQWALELEQSAQDGRDAPDYPNQPDGGVSGLVVLGGTGLSYALTRIALIMIWPQRHTAFLVGDGLARDLRRRRNRERVVWGILIALILGVVSSVLASKLFGA
jgi:hypothetical protein